ncbi:MAG: protein translocase subunit SecF [Eubacteriales bacterium]|nr:protein translocase subunit SecF [Eubacteriales bacterium]
MRKISFYQNRRWFFLLSAVFMIAGILVSLIFGIKMDITFKGGSILKYAYEGTVDLDQAQSVIAAAIQNEVTIQETTNLGDNKTFLVVNVAGSSALSPDEQIALKDALVTTFPDTTFSLESANLVDPFIGRELLNKGLWAIALASILIVAFVWFSFRSMSGPSAGVMGLVALFHDVFVAFFMFVILRIPLNESLVAVVLTILGFSINDTIVVYDRIRENERLYKGKMPLSELVDLSINQSLTRSINTSLATFGAIGVAYVFAFFFNIDSIKQFALPMMVGLISGTYSTICLAGPLWVMWKTRGGRTGY